MDLWDKEGGISVNKRLGYGSRYDGDFLELDLCAQCLDELIDSCVIKPVDPEDSI